MSEFVPGEYDRPRLRLLLRSLTILFLLAATLLLIAGPIAQDLDYHAFADDHTRFGIPRFWNVVSNAPFLMVGALGLRRLRGREGPSITAWRVFSAAVLLVGFGSSWYHLDPTNASLVWDRLPMAMGFMALFVAFLTEQVSTRCAAWLPGFVALGLASVVHWAWCDDLRLYAFVQFFPLLSLLLMLLILPAMRAELPFLVPALIAYALAKLLEAGDLHFAELTGHVMSGHPLKHIAAAFGPWFLVRRFRRSAEV